MQSLFLSSNKHVHLHGLETLELSVRVDPTWEQQRSGESDYSDLSQPPDPDSFTPILKLLADHRHTLRSLSIASRDPLDWTPLFFSLPCMPRLHTLALSIPACQPHFGDPSGLSFFLNSHGQTLRSLTLRVTQLSGSGIPIADEEPLETWIQTVMSQVHLPFLTSIDLTTSLLPLGAAIRCIRRFTSSLQSLYFTGHVLSIHDVQQVLSEFDEPGLKGSPRALGCLRVLRLGTVTLSPQLFDLISERIPYLEKLELSIKDVVPTHGDCAIYFHDPSDWQDESQVVRHFSSL